MNRGSIKAGRSAAALSILVFLGACGGTATESVGGSAATLAASAEPTPAGVMEFTVAATSLSLSDLAILAAMDELRDQGYTIEYAELTAPELVTEGLARGDFQFTSGAFNVYALAIQQDAAIKVVMERGKNDWEFYSVRDIETCAQLDGRRIAIHSEGSASTAMVRNYVAEECPGTEPEYLIISGSENRYAALIAGQIDASALEGPDALAIDAEAGDRFHALTSFAETLPNLRTTVFATNADFAEENPDTVRAYLREVLKQHRRIADEDGYLAELVEQYQDVLIGGQTDEAVQRMVDLEFFPVDGGLTLENVQYTLDFYTEIGSLEPGLTAEEVTDLSYLEAILQELDG